MRGLKVHPHCRSGTNPQPAQTSYNLLIYNDLQSALVLSQTDSVYFTFLFWV